MSGETDYKAYTAAATAALGVDLDEAAIKRVAAALEGLFVMAGPMNALKLDDDLDPAPVIA